jgi:hemoglobin
MDDERAATLARRRDFAAASPISEAMIEALVHEFYGRVRREPTLGPIFERVVTDWPGHLAKLTDFWSSVTLMSGRFKGSPMQAHARIDDLEPGHFAIWLALFEKTACEVCTPEAAAIFIEKSRMIARSLKIGLQLARGDFEDALET